MQQKRYTAADAKIIVDRMVSSAASGFEREALLILAGEALKEANEWISEASEESFRSSPPPHQDTSLLMAQTQRDTLTKSKPIEAIYEKKPMMHSSLKGYDLGKRRGRL